MGSNLFGGSVQHRIAKFTCTTTTANPDRKIPNVLQPSPDPCEEISSIMCIVGVANGSSKTLGLAKF